MRSSELHKLALLLPFLLVACRPQRLEYHRYEFSPTTAKVVRPTPTPSRALSQQEQRWEQAQVKKEKLHYVQAIASRIEDNKTRYDSVSVKTNVPWDVIGGLHYRESDLDFKAHLHNGDPLYAKTRHVPRNRPPGNPPFAWTYSAVDALRFDRLDKESWKTLNERLNNIEAFNGTGYYRYGVPSPYLYSMTSIYKSGKFISDGHYSPTAIDQEAGVAAIWKVQ
jgi:lysozyme family protein